jgi:hypothetical protein
MLNQLDHTLEQAMNMHTSLTHAQVWAMCELAIRKRHVTKKCRNNNISCTTTRGILDFRVCNRIAALSQALMPGGGKFSEIYFLFLLNQ